MAGFFFWNSTFFFLRTFCVLNQPTRKSNVETQKIENGWGEVSSLSAYLFFWHEENLAFQHKPERIRFARNPPIRLSRIFRSPPKKTKMFRAKRASGRIESRQQKPCLRIGGRNQTKGHPSFFFPPDILWAWPGLRIHLIFPLTGSDVSRRNLTNIYSISSQHMPNVSRNAVCS